MYPFQSYYSNYYARYLEEYEKHHTFTATNSDRGERATVESAIGREETSVGKNIEAALLMDDIMNNGINFCAIM